MREAHEPACRPCFVECEAGAVFLCALGESRGCGELGLQGKHFKKMDVSIGTHLP